MQTEKTVHSVRTLDETERIIFSSDRLSLKLYLEKLIVGAIVFFADICISLLRHALFSHKYLKDINVQDIVVYTVGIVGDNVVMLPALAAIRRRYPDAHITVISNCQLWDKKGAEAVFGPSRLKDRLIVISDYPVERHGFKLVYNKNLFPDVACDLFINLSPFGNRGWIGAVIKEMLFAYKLGAVHAVGFHVESYSRKKWFNMVKHYFVLNEPRRSRRVLAELGIEPVEGEDLFEHDPEARQSVMRKLQHQGWDGRPLFVINPGAKFRSKCWPAERFGEIAKHIEAQYNCCPVITGIAEERDIAEEVVRSSAANAISLAGLTTIQGLVELLRISAGCITNDTGTMHIAAMVNVPTVAIFSMRHSPTNWFPLGKNIMAVFSTVNCRFCYDDECCKGDCLEMIEPLHVKEALGRVLNEKNDMANSGRVIIAIPVLLQGGSEIQTMALVRALTDAGYGVEVYCYYEHDDAMVASMESAGADVTLMNLLRADGLFHLFKRLKAMFKSARPDIVHVQYLAPGLVPVLAAKLSGVKTIFSTVHISGGIAYGLKARFLLRIAALFCTAFFCVSKSTEKFWFGSSEIFDTTAARKGRKHFTIYNAIDVARIDSVIKETDLARFRQTLGLSGRTIIGTVGRLAYQKGHSVLLDAMPAIIEKVPSVVLLVIGKGPERVALEEKVKKLGIEGNIIWLGEKQHNEVFSLLGLMDIFAMPSLYEGFGLTAAEAMAAARPVVASDVDGLCELIDDGETGFLVPPGNSGRLATAVITLLERPELAKSMGQKGYTKVGQMFSMKNFNGAMTNAYRVLK